MDSALSARSKAGMPLGMRSPEHEASDEQADTPSSEVVRVLVGNHRQFLAFLERRVSSRALAEDVLQEAFARGLDRIDHLRSEGSAIAWFYRLLRNAVVDSHRRQASASRGVEAFAAELEHRSEPCPDMHEVVCQCIAQLADTLKPEYASALKRIEVDGVAVKDYAVEAGISSSNAAVRVFRARDALRKQVARSCGTCADHGCLDCTFGSKTSGGHKHGNGCS